MLQPNEAAILTLFGKYAGTDRSNGLRRANALYVKRKISLRARNLNAPTLKVNDKRGNPVEVSAVAVWRVNDTARAVFDVDDFEHCVKVQAEAATRHLATQFACDEGEDLAPGETTLRSGEAVAALKAALQARFDDAGVMAEREIFVLDDERKAAMVSNLLVVLCSDRDTQPIVNAGTLYS